MDRQGNVMIPILLSQILNDKLKTFGDLFESLDLVSFNGSISLQEYQVAALQKALCSLKLYRDDTKELCYEYKQAFKYNNIKLDSKKGLDIKEFCNMASFWMATGSGKSIVMIKLISLMQKLMKNGEIESKPIMLLVPNDKILDQFKTHIQSFNAYQPIQITCKEIKAYDNQSLLDFENVVFLGRSDLLDIKDNVGKDSKAKRLNYDDLMREKGWYILLDEAHKGDSKDSIRKSYIRDLAKGRERQEYPHGFIFNFSATFDNDIELFTCAFNYNLEKFNNDGYGKNIVVLDSNLKAFKDSKVDSSDEKLERIMESFILFVGIKQELKSLKARFENLHYHNPLIIAVADKVNTKDAGIKLYFEAIMEILKDSKDISEIAKNLAKKLETSKIYFAEKEMNKDFVEKLAKIDSKDLREQIFYAKETSSLECCKIKGNNKELAFKSKNATKPFLLLNICSKKAKKYVLQTIGRGVRIESFLNKRKRLNFLKEEMDFNEACLKYASALETLFIMASDNKAIGSIIEGLSVNIENRVLKGFKKTKTLSPLPVPKYKDRATLHQQYKISAKEAEGLRELMRSYDEDVLIVNRCLYEGFQYSTLEEIKKFNEGKKSQIQKSGGNEDKFDAKRTLKTINSTLNARLKEFDQFEDLKDEIKHYKEMSTSLNEGEVEKINVIIRSVLVAKSEIELEEEVKKSKISFKEALKRAKLDEIQFKENYIISAKLKRHYYNPLIIYNNDDGKSKINFAIIHESEREFLQDLEKNLQNDAFLKDYEWCFLKLVEKKDEIYIPYFDEREQKERKFYPDFIFWIMCKTSKEFKIFFIDPKGLSREENAKFKINTFKKLFSQNLTYNNEKIEVILRYYNKNAQSDVELKKYTKSSVKELFEEIL
ncbi:DEAD/DEAH box helicase family protein [Campylobacter upsaliensis]|nr:DEAD/DEAH box helicase family protein [Campylobacter upsaliensis]EAH5847464.1 DEAD/DEAH box helicase [Campylobacter upsaliensis]EAH5977365.1 DEAD/DEAH box helicase [Campylobacter upsaliensis]EAH6866444.1 DEAD/DEAH box helicase [Campylobacter upsaliensis]EAH9850712.1 DEAD/DEAH box helicase [Campylobacter upsaliensis]EAI4339174.1 DEAD/DEAH box helicase [Campylobacter upsaliensis]